jgi:hypothetical protein
MSTVTLRASTISRLTLGTTVRDRIAAHCVAARALLAAPPVDPDADPAEVAAQIAAFTTRLEGVEAVLAVEDSADWYCCSADGCFRTEEDFIAALMDADEYRYWAGAAKPETRAFACYRAFTV